MQVHYCDGCGAEIEGSSIRHQITLTEERYKGGAYGSSEVLGPRDTCDSCFRTLVTTIKDLTPGPGRDKDGRVGQ